MYAGIILMDAGYCALEAGNTAEALRLLQMHEHAIRLLFTDVQMPGADDGWVLAHRCNVRWPHIDILITSGHVAPSLNDLPPGAVFITKPFNERGILKALNDLTISRRSS